jgi:polysaccharide biosynthesis protein PslH
MRILCLTSRLPYPPDRGDRLRAYHILRHLGQEHELTLVSFIRREAERDHIQHLGAFCRDVRVVHQGGLGSAVTTGLNLWRSEPLQTLYYRSSAMQRQIDALLANNGFQAAYIHLFRMAPYLTDHRELYRIVDLTDVISQEVARSLPYRSRPWRLIYTLERPRIERYEKVVANTFEETWLISEQDRQVLSASCPEANIQVVPNGVDLEQLFPLGEPAVPHSLIFVGHMRVPHNVDAAVYLVSELLPLVQRQFPDCRLTLVGANPGPEVLGLAENPAVTVTGYVADLNRYLNRAAIFVAPLRFAAGVQNKVLEAMAAGRPVVTTSLVNQGLGAQPERDLLIADTAAEQANQIGRLLVDPKLASHVGLAGRSFVARRFSWQHAVERLRTIAGKLDR